MIDFLKCLNSCQILFKLINFRPKFFFNPKKCPTKIFFYPKKIPTKFFFSHPNPVMQKLVIQNLKSREEMKAENFNYDILKFVTISNDYFIAGNGHIRRREENQPRQHSSFPTNPRYGARPPQQPNQFQPAQHIPVVPQFQRAQFQPTQPTRPRAQPGNSSLLDNLFSFDPIPSNNTSTIPEPQANVLGAAPHASQATARAGYVPVQSPVRGAHGRQCGQ